MPYPCQICSKVCMTSRGLTQHISIHNMIVARPERLQEESSSSYPRFSPEHGNPAIDLLPSVSMTRPHVLSELDPEFHIQRTAGIKRTLETQTDLDDETHSPSTSKIACLSQRDDDETLKGVPDEIHNWNFISESQFDDSEDDDTVALQIEPSEGLDINLIDSDTDDDYPESESDTMWISSAAKVDLNESSGEELAVPELNFIRNQRGGWVLDSLGAMTKWEKFCEKIGWSEESPVDNPYYPWNHEGELWLSDLLYRRGRVSTEFSDELLREFANGNMTMSKGPIQFQNTRQLHDLLDVATINDVPFKTKKWNILHAHESWTGFVTLFYRDMLAVIQSLMSNPSFKDDISFSPEQHFTKEGVRRYGELHWSTFWWEVQDKLEEGATVIPILLGIDETHVNLLGRTKVHPLYMTIGNIHKRVRRTYSRNAYRVLAYFPVLEGTKREREHSTFKLAKKNLYHMCMSECLNQLREYGERGCIMKGPDGKLRDCHPVLFSIAMDYPESCMFTLVRPGAACPVCVATQENFDDLSRHFEFRNPRSMSKAIRKARLTNEKSAEIDLRNIGLINMEHPLWDIPYNNVYQMVTPDMLHQVKKGVWEHLLNLFQRLITTTYDPRTAKKYLTELDVRFAFVPRFPGQKQFTKGITQLSQVTGSEYFQIMSIFAACGRGFFNTSKPIQCVVAFIEWYYQASLPMHTDQTLQLMSDAFKRFDKLKEVFVNVSSSSLKFPKMHMLTHFIYFIRRYGTLDNVDTEYTEHAHIAFAKVPYRRTNKREPLPQIIKHIVRGEAIERKINFLESKSSKTEYNRVEDFARRTLSSRIADGPLHVKEVEKLFELKGLDVALRTYFHDISYEDISPGSGKGHRVSKSKLPLLDNGIITIYQTLTFYIEDTFCDNDDASRRQIIRAHQQFHKSARYDWFIIMDLENSAVRQGSANGMDCYKVGQARIFFEIVQGGERYHLAYVNWFEKRERKDEETGMHIVDRTQKFNVIGVAAIVQSVHLQPLFEERSTAMEARSKNYDVYSFASYVINKYSDRASWEKLY